MELKKAITVCLISLFSATLVMLIARALDLHAASRIEPQLAQIVEELQALREQGGIAAAPGTAARECLTVYYFHSNKRCAKCQAIESQSHEIVHADFAPQLANGRMKWKIVNFEEPAGEDLKNKFSLHLPMVILARTTGGKIGDWKPLDKVWALVGDKPAFADYVRREIQQMLATTADEPSATAAGDPVDDAMPPIPEVESVIPPVLAPETDPSVPDDLPVPDEEAAAASDPLPDTFPGPDDIPVPE